MAVAAAAAAVGGAAWTSGVFSSQTDRYTGTWLGPDGSPAARGESRGVTFEVTSRPGPDHCDWDAAVFLLVGWPLGTTQGIDLGTEARTYIRDASGVLPRSPLDGQLDVDADLPADSTSTGYSTDGIQLWFGPDMGDAYAYLVDGDDVERWPRAVEPPACA